MLDLDAAALPQFLAQMTGWIADQAPPGGVRRVLDLGSGTGTGTLALLGQFPGAHVMAVDASTSMLSRLDKKVAALGLAGSVSTYAADVDRDWPPLSDIDLVWASSSMHHFADPGAVLRNVGAALSEHGLVAVVEMTDFPTFLPFDQGVGQPGLEQRCGEVLNAQRAPAVPNIESDWAARLSGAGLEVISTIELDLESELPPSPDVRRYAAAVLRRMHRATKGTVDPGDTSALEVLLAAEGPHSLAVRGDVHLTSRRTAWLARRPGSGLPGLRGLVGGNVALGARMAPPTASVRIASTSSSGRAS